MRSGSAAQRFVQQLHPMAHWQAAATLQVGDAANVGTQNTLGLQCIQVAQFAVAQLLGQVGVEHTVGARRTAAQVRF